MNPMYGYKKGFYIAKKLLFHVSIREMTNICVPVLKCMLGFFSFHFIYLFMFEWN